MAPVGQGRPYRGRSDWDCGLKDTGPLAPASKLAIVGRDLPKARFAASLQG